MKFTAEQIAGILEGEVVGNPNAEVSKLAKIEEGIEIPQGYKVYEAHAERE